eukprot:jgi/Chrzof1/14869/Cz09g18310.t1_LCYE[v5.2]
MQPALVDRPAARCSCLGRQYHTKPFTSHPRTQPARQARSNVSVAYPIDAVTTPSPGGGHDHNQAVREGHYEADLVKAQANKQDGEQPKIASILQPLQVGTKADAVVVGCGPAGLYLAAQMAQRGLKVGLIGPDVPFVNNYGVWVDEFKQLGLEHTLECQWPDAVCYFGEGNQVNVGRAYGRVCRRRLRQHLVDLCKSAGVQYLATEVTDICKSADNTTAYVTCSNGSTFTSRLVTLASGQAAGRFLQYEPEAPAVAAQTAYGIEAEVEGYDAAYGNDHMLFMDYRRHHTGLWDGGATKLNAGNHPNANDGLWGSSDEVPSFLYAMPLGGNRVFLEETCLVAKPALPFKVLQRRLERRMRSMGIKVTRIHETEWSYIPVGGPLPSANQPITAFGAAANLVHPATGFSVSRSLREAPVMAEAAVQALSGSQTVPEVAAAVWQALWPDEKRRQASFHLFGMELLAQLDLSATNAFFNTFFALPPTYWKGFLGSRLSSVQLLGFALLTFVLAPANIKGKLVSHLMTDPAGRYLISHYISGWSSKESAMTGAPTEAAVAAALMMWQLAAATQVQQ